MHSTTAAAQPLYRILLHRHGLPVFLGTSRRLLRLTAGRRLTMFRRNFAGPFCAGERVAQPVEQLTFNQ